MKYRVTAEHDGADTSDQITHTSMVDAVRDMVWIGQQPPDSGGPWAWTIELV